MTVQDIVDSSINKQQFGIEYYNPKPSHKDLIPSKGIKLNKQPRTTYIEEIANSHAFVPEPGHSFKRLDWIKFPGLSTCKFLEADRLTPYGEIAR